MKQRISILELEPKAYEAMMGLEKYIAQSTIEPSLSEMIRLRASQINGCTYCIEMHSELVLKHEVQQDKVIATSTWWESPLFSDKEKAALAMTDEITRITTGGLSEKTYEESKKHFSENEIAQLIMLIGTINTWNRMAISTHMVHKK